MQNDEAGTTVEGWRRTYSGDSWWGKLKDTQHSKVNLLRFSQLWTAHFLSHQSQPVHLLPNSSLHNFSAVLMWF